jgi:hypothetical protein
MSRSSLASLSIVAMTAVLALGLVPAARADLITTVTKFNGTITDVGVIRGPGQTGGVEYRIKGLFEYPGPIDLTLSTLTITQFFVENDSAPGAGDGAGELMRQSQGFGDPSTDPALAPITIPLRKGEEDEAKYETVRFRPQIVSKFKTKDGTTVEFDIRLDRGMMRERPQRCALESDGRRRTPITISFTLNDAAAAPITVLFTRPWECPQEGRYHLRARD